MLSAIAFAALLGGSPRQVPQNSPVGLNQAVTYVVAEGSGGTDFVRNVLPRIDADVVVRAWFKWREAPPVASWTDEPAAAHKLGTLFGGGITCSALYDGENGLTADQVHDMATRDPAGNLVDAWGQAGIRHGTLSNPAYIAYLFRWCKAQIDAGADYLFMDERQAARSDREGYDDYSLRDFARYLRDSAHFVDGDQRLRSQYGVNTGNRDLLPSGKIEDFRYRQYMLKMHLVADPASPKNLLYPLWAKFEMDRDDRAWKTLTDEIRAYAASLGRTVYISGNGLDPYVDLQVLGVWNHWVTVGGHIDMSEDQIPIWRSMVEQGRAIAGKRVPVVLFHDWGFGNPPFPFLAVSPAERAIWLRTRAAEIYAAGAYFGFPVLGPGGCDAAKDGSLPLIGDLTRFYRAHRALYAGQEWLGHNTISVNRGGLSVAASWLPVENMLAIHAINRNVRDGAIQNQQDVDITLPLAQQPKSVEVISPDPGQPAPASARIDQGRCVVRLPSLQAYSVVLLHFDAKPDLAGLRDVPRYFLNPRWERANRNEFTVDREGAIEHAEDLAGILQGRLHGDLRNPPVFWVNFNREMRFRVHVRAVATQGARVQISLSGGDIVYALLPDLDGKNDPGAKEYDRVLECAIPPGPHRVTLDNDGPDWASIDWLEFVPVARHR